MMVTITNLVLLALTGLFVFVLKKAARENLAKARRQFDGIVCAQILAAIFVAYLERGTDGLSAKFWFVVLLVEWIMFSMRRKAV